MSYVHKEDENCMVLVAKVVNRKIFRPAQIKSMKKREAVKVTRFGPLQKGVYKK